MRGNMHVRISGEFKPKRFEFIQRAEAIYKAQSETGEVKGHYLNATAGTCEEMVLIFEYPYF